MKSKAPSGCEFGQLSLHSSLVFKSATSSKDETKEDPQTKPPEKKKNSRISLSEFLKRKLESDASPSPPPKSAQEKPFASLAETKGAVGTLHEHIAATKRGTATPTIDETIFQQFRHPRNEQEDDNHPSTGGGGRMGKSITTDEQNLRKRRNPFRVSSIGREVKHTTPKHLVILGDDPKPKRRAKGVSTVREKKPKMFFNHYGNGGGFWDCNMEGIDAEEVGSSEVWEGMGSTTLGGLQWH